MLSFDTPVQGHLTYPNQVVTHTIEIEDESSDLVVALEGLQSNVDVTISAVNNEFHLNNPETSEEHWIYSKRSLPLPVEDPFTTELPPGIYNLQLRLVGENPSDYKLTVRQTATDNSYDAGALTESPVFYSRGINSTTTHTYSFKVATKGLYQVLANSSAPSSTGLQLTLKKGGSTVTTSTVSSSLSKSFVKELEPGDDYALEVTSTGTEDYQVSLQRIQPAEGSFNNPHKLQLSNLSANVQGSVSLQQPEQYYRLVLPRKSDLILFLHGLQANADLYLVDKDGAQINLTGSVPAKSENVSNGSEYLNVRAMTTSGTEMLPAGVYYVKVKLDDSETVSTPFALDVKVNYSVGGDFIAAEAATSDVYYQPVTNYVPSSSSTFLANAGTYTVVATGDINNDGNEDVILQEFGTTNTIVWYLTSSQTYDTYAFLPSVANANVKIVGVADFDGDAKNDLLVYDYSANISDRLKVMRLNNTSLLSTVSVPLYESEDFLFYVPQFPAAAVADLNRDGSADLLTCVLSGGVCEQHIHLFDKMNLNESTPTKLPTWSASAVIRGVGDFNNDLLPDAVTYDGTTGKLWFNLMDESGQQTQVHEISYGTTYVPTVIRKSTPSTYVDLDGNANTRAGLELAVPLQSSLTLKDAVVSSEDANDAYYFDPVEEEFTVDITAPSGVAWSIRSDNPAGTQLDSGTGNTSTVIDVTDAHRYYVVLSTSSTSPLQYTLSIE